MTSRMENHHPYEDQYTLKYLNQGTWINLRVVNNLSALYNGQIKRADFVDVVDQVLGEETHDDLKRVQLKSGRFIQVQLVEKEAEAEASCCQRLADLVTSCFRSKKD